MRRRAALPCPSPANRPPHKPRGAGLGRVLLGLGLGAAACGAAAQDGPGGLRSGVDPAADGAALYQRLCQACHMADARGNAGLVPALARNPRLADPGYPIDRVLRGRGAMPWFGRTLTAAQVAAVVTYVRQHFGNQHTAAVTEAEVKALSTDLPSDSD